MAHHKSAKKRIRTSERRRLRNKASMSRLKTLIKSVFSMEDKDKAAETLKEAVAYIDKIAVKGRIHKNNAARKKSQLTRFVNNLGTSAE